MTKTDYMLRGVVGHPDRAELWAHADGSDAWTVILTGQLALVEARYQALRAAAGGAGTVTDEGAVLDALDFTPELPCESAVCGGAEGHTAQFHVRMTCGHGGVFCTDATKRIIVQSKERIGWHAGCDQAGIQVTNVRRIA